MEEENREKRKKRGFRFGPFLMALFLLFCLSSGMVGYLLGKQAGGSGGSLVDTIVLSPGDSSARAASGGGERGVLHFLSGKLLYGDGGPVEGASVSLGEDRSAVTDGAGKFYLSDVRSGAQTLKVSDGDGNVLGSMTLTLDFSGGEEISADTGEENVFHMPEETRLLELTLTVAEDSALSVEEGSACFVTRDGQVVNFNGGALRLERGQRAVTPAGALVSSGGTVVLPSQALAISPQGTQVEVETGREIVPGTVLEEDGSAVMEEGATLLPTDEVELPDGETVGGEDSVVLVEDGSATELPELPEEYVPQAELRSTPSPAPSPSPSLSPAPSEAEPAVSAEEEATPTPAPTPTPEPTPDPEAPNGGLRVVDSAASTTWSQMSAVDLFRRRYNTEDGEAPTESGLPVAKPGDSGYYDFRLENPEDFDVVFTLTIQENKFHLPIRYSVIDMADDYAYLYRDAVWTTDGLSTQELYLPAGASMELRIEWEWDFEDWYAPRRDNAYATSAASSDDRVYRVSLFIRAEGLNTTPAFEDPDGTTRYPGLHGNTDPIRERLGE